MKQSLIGLLPSFWVCLMCCMWFHVVLSTVPIQGAETYMHVHEMELPPYEEYFFTQKLNHFDFSDNRTFPMRYLKSEYYFNPVQNKNAPVFVYTGNEGSIEEFYKFSSGFMFEAAKKFGATVLFIEHRYYGRSVPFIGDDQAIRSLSGEEMSHLSSEQALADFASLLQSLYGVEDNRTRSIIVFGGSYGGILSAGMRMKYPNVVDGAIAASAPLMLFNGLADPYKFYSIITEVYKNATSYPTYPFATCDVLIKDGITGLSQIEALNIKDSKKAHIFVKLIPILLSTIAQVNYPYPVTSISDLPGYPVRVFCDTLASKMKNGYDFQNNVGRNPQTLFNIDLGTVSKKQQVNALLKACSDFFSAMVNGTELDSIPYNSDSLGNYAWDYQACTEMVFPMANSASDSMFIASEWSVSSHREYCKVLFPNITNMELREHWAALYYGGKNGIRSTSNIFLSHGQLDPWRAGAFDKQFVDTSLPNSVKQQIIEEGAHHLDLRSAVPQDPQSVTTVRKHELQEISNWIFEFNNKQKVKDLSRTQNIENSVSFSPCPLQYRGNYSGLVAECALVTVSLDPMKDENAVPSTNTIQLFVKRLRANTNSHAKRVLWLLPGGPGFASDGIEPFLPLLIQLTNGKFDVYTTEHRGVGRSTRIGCVTAQSETPGSDGGYSITDAEWPTCAQGFVSDWSHNEAYMHFTSKAGGIDLAKLIRKINVESSSSPQEVFLYGVSYGTAWLSRFLRYCELYDQYLMQNVIKGVVMDGVVSTMETATTQRLLFSVWDSVAKEISEKFLRYCHDSEVIQKYDSLCSKKIKGDAVSFLHTVMDKVYPLGKSSATSTCPELVETMPRDTMAALLNDLLVDQYPRILIPAILYRMNRCDKEIDLPVLKNLRKYYESVQRMLSVKQELPLNSDVLFYHLAFSEFWDKSLTIQQINTEPKYILRSNTLKWYNILKNSNWKTYEPDLEYFNKTFSTNTVQVLLVNGDLDPQTPLWSARSQNENIGGHTHRLITVPFAVHGTMVKSPVKSMGKPDCVLQIFVNFLKMETPDVNKVDVSCLNDLSFDFKGMPEVNINIMGVEDIYEGVLAPEPKPSQEITYSQNTLVGAVVGSVFGGIILGLIIGVLVFSIVVKHKKSARTKLGDDTKYISMIER